jgi:dTDP-4-amino-4,6-dideoxygalactose transaminase
VTVPIAAPEISSAAKEAVVEVLDSGMIADGEHVREFEASFAEYVGTEHAIATSSGTTALHAMFEATGIGEGDVVVTSPFSFISSANAIKHAGAEPVFADVDPETFNLDPESTRELVERRDDITAVMPVHLYGLPADMDAFRDLAAEFDLHLFEDAAQAHGSTVDGEMVGSIADAAAFSFYPTKNMTTGEGGMITTDDDEIAQRARQVINHGRSGSYEHEFVGYNFRMTNTQAVIGQDQLQRLSEWIDQRQENAKKLTEGFENLTTIETPTIPSGRTHAFHQYTVRTDDRAVLQSTLESADVGYGVYYPTTIPDQPAYEQDADIPVARQLVDSVLSLPVHPHLTTDDIDTIINTIRADAGVTQ